MVFSVIIAVIVFYLLVASLGGQTREQRLERAWATWPTLSEYLERNPDAKTRSGPACTACNSRNIHEFRWDSDTPNLRIHRCRTCNTKLYRSRL